MAEKTPAESGAVEPVEPAPVEPAPVEVVTSDAETQAAVAEPVEVDAAPPAPPAEPVVAEPATVHETGNVETVASETPTATTPAVVYVSAPQPPRAKGARGVGALVALLGAGIFALAYSALVAILGLLVPGFGIAGAVRFTGTPTFWVPVIVFALAYLLLIVIVNRAGWWAHVLGGFIVALIVWVGFIGAAIIAAGAFGAPAPVVGAVVLEQLTNPLGWAAAIAAREVPVWVGGIVSRRGRAARAKNVEARAAYESDLAAHRATVGH